MTTRRGVLFLFAMAGLPAFAQERKIWRIGFLGAARADTPVWARRVEAFRAGLGELGYVEGKNIAIEFRWAEGSAERLPALAAELVRLKVDVIARCSSTRSSAARKPKTCRSRCPSTFCFAPTG